VYISGLKIPEILAWASAYHDKKVDSDSNMSTEWKAESAKGVKFLKFSENMMAVSGFV
jgi:hypothetical protein